jgi:hypothetical protein
MRWTATVSPSNQVVELQFVWVFELIEQSLHPPKLGVHDAEEQLHTVVGSAVWPDDPVEVLLDAHVRKIERLHHTCDCVEGPHPLTVE